MSLSLQKANLWKRISAWLFDVVMVLVITLGLAIPTNAVLKYDDYYAEYSAIKQAHFQQAEQDYGVRLDLTQEEYDGLNEADRQLFDTARAQAEENLSKDKQAAELNSKLLSIMIATVCIAAFFAFLIWHFILPLIFKDGRTLGKKFFGLAVVRTNCVKISAPVLFVRSMVGLYAMETVAVAFLCMLGTVGIFAAVLVQVLQVYVMVKTPTQSIHDLLSDTVVVDYSSQQIFDTQEDLESFLAAEKEEASPCDTPTNE